MGWKFDPFTATMVPTASGGGGGGTILGTIEAPQIAFGTALDTIGGSNALTYITPVSDTEGGVTIGSMFTGQGGLFTVGFGGDVETPDVYIGSPPSEFTPSIGSTFLSGDQCNIAFFGPSQNRFSCLQAVIETTDEGEVGIQALSMTQGASGIPAAFQGVVGNSGTHLLALARSVLASGRIESSGGVTDGFVYVAAAPTYVGSGRFVNYYGFSVPDWSSVGTSINYGFHSLLSSGSGKYAIYAAGTAPSHFGGSVDVPAGGLTVGTGVLTLANNFTTAGAFAVTQTYTGATNVTFPTSGTLLTTSGSGASLTFPGTLSIASGKTLTASNTLTLTGTDSTSFAFPSSSDTVVTLAATQTLTNKRITKRVVTASDATSITPNTDNADVTYQANTQAAGTLTINADGGAPTNGQAWLLKVKCTNAQTLSWNAVYVGGTIALPTVTSGSSKIDNFAFLYDTVNSVWEFTGSATGF